MTDLVRDPLTKWCEIDLTLLAHNINEVEKLLAATTKIMAVVKDNAYAHGDTIIANEMESLGIDYFAVSHLDEAIRLRKGGITSDILILTYTSPDNFALLTKYHLTQALISLEYARKLDSFCMKNHCHCSAHVKIDTGMHRLGLCYDGTLSTLKPIIDVYKLTNVTITGTYTHFAVADSVRTEDIAYTKTQYQLFKELTHRLKEENLSPGLLHVQNTPATLQYPEFQCDYIRVGTLLLGLPYGDVALSPEGKRFQPIFSLKARVSMVKTLPPNAKVSYGLNYTTSGTEQIASVAIGYGDGYQRALSNRQVAVLIHGQLAKVIGNICMDQLLINVTSIPNVREGDIVTLVGTDNGKTITLDYLATLLNTLNNEIVDHINPRIPRVYTKDGNAFIKYLQYKP